ncbi:MAG: septal ring lytic transglycosylase RlpA family protein [Aliihoeflea sp.]
MKLPGLAVLSAAFVTFSLLGAPSVHASQQPVVQTASGTASWYGSKFHGRRTANGERYDMHQLTAAHRTLPFGTKVRVTNQRNGRSVVVRINDRGPFAGRRIIDLSRGAAGQIGMVNSGVAPVKLEVLR